MTGARDHLDHPDDRPAAGPTRRVAGPDAVPAIAGPADPRLAHGGDAGGGLLHLQRTAGNAAVSSLLAPTVQRAIEIDEVSTDVSPVGGEAGTAGTGPAAGVDAAAGPVSSDGSNTTISGATINLDAAMTQTDGVLRAGTIIADSVVATSYTPGAGNLW